MKLTRKVKIWAATQAFLAMLLCLTIASFAVVSGASKLLVIGLQALAAACGLVMWLEWHNAR